MNGELHFMSSSLSDNNSFSFANNFAFFTATCIPEPLSSALYTAPNPLPLTPSFPQIPHTQQFSKFVLIHPALMSEDSDKTDVSKIQIGKSNKQLHLLNETD